MNKNKRYLILAIIFIFITLIGTKVSYSHFECKNNIKNNKIAIGSLAKGEVKIYALDGPIYARAISSLEKKAMDDYKKWFNNISDGIVYYLNKENIRNNYNEISNENNPKVRMQFPIEIFTGKSKVSNYYLDRRLHYIILISNGIRRKDDRLKLNILKSNIKFSRTDFYRGKVTNAIYKDIRAKNESKSLNLLKAKEDVIKGYDWNGSRYEYANNLNNCDLLILDISNEDYKSKEFFFEDETMFQYNIGSIYFNDEVTYSIVEKMRRYGDSNAILEKSEFNIEFNQGRDILNAPFKKYNLELIE